MCKFKGYVDYIFSLWNKNSDRGGCDDFEIYRRYYENVGTFTWILKCNVRFMLTITFVMFRFYVINSNFILSVYIFLILCLFLLQYDPEIHLRKVYRDTFLKAKYTQIWDVTQNQHEFVIPKILTDLLCMILRSFLF